MEVYLIMYVGITKDGSLLCLDLASITIVLDAYCDLRF